MIGSFTEVKPMFYWVQHILPLVYDDSLSYMELLGKVTKTLNELVENNNLLPDCIMKLIKEYISSGEIEKVLAEVLANYMLNVKFPPAGLTPATGDGTADDTEAIQGCIDYAFNNGGMAVYFPSGSYLVQSLTLRNKSTLFGNDRYTTRLILKGGATAPLFVGNVDKLTLTGLGFDGNMDIQVNNVDLIDLTVNSAIITNLLLTDGYDLLKITVNEDLQLNDVIFNHAVTNALVSSGNGYIQGYNLIFKTVSALVGENFTILNNNNSILEQLKFEGASPKGITVNGSNNVIKLWSSDNIVTAYVDNGNNNSFSVYTKSESQKLTGSKWNIIGGFYHETITGNKEVTAADFLESVNNKMEVIAGAKSVSVNKSNENVTTEKTVNANTLTEEITLKNVTADTSNENLRTKTETLTEDKTVNARNSHENLTGNKYVKANTLTEELVTINETVSGNKIVNAQNSTENVTDNKTVTTNDLNVTVNQNSTENVTGNKGVNVHGSVSETIDGTLTEINHGHTETITGNDTKTVSGTVSEESQNKEVTANRSYIERGFNKTETFTGAKNETLGSSRETIAGDKVITAANSAETVQGDKTINAGDYAETITGNKTVQINVDSNETINGTDYKKSNAAQREFNQLNETVTGNKVVRANNINENATLERNVSATTHIKSGNTETTTLQTAGTINSPEYTLNIANHLTYEQPQSLNQWFDSIKMKAPNGTAYNVLVDRGINNFQQIVDGVFAQATRTIYQIREKIGIDYAKSQNAIKILFLGDSVMAGTDVLKPNQIMYHLLKMFTNVIPTEYVNLAVPNSNLTNFLNPNYKIPNTDLVWQTAAAGVNADVIICFWGVNECSFPNSWQDSRRIAENISAFEQIMKTENNSIYYFTSELINVDSPYTDARQNKSLLSIADTFRSMTRQNGRNICDFNAIMQMLYMAENPFAHRFGITTEPNGISDETFKNCRIYITKNNNTFGQFPPMLEIRGDGNGAHYTRLIMDAQGFYIIGYDGVKTSDPIQVPLALGAGIEIVFDGAQILIGESRIEQLANNVYEGVMNIYFNDNNSFSAVVTPMYPSPISNSPLPWSDFFGPLDPPNYIDGNGFTHPNRNGTYMIARCMAKIVELINETFEYKP